tara:strand:- start:626 stop:844 length:219 start_codon:yes stop_codon:yes gene_type:complete
MSNKGVLKIQSPGKPEKVIKQKKKKSKTSLAQSILKEDIKELEKMLSRTEQPSNVRDLIAHKKKQLKSLQNE